jgi:hypothetical protein
MMTLVVFYFLMAYQPPYVENLLGGIATKVIGIASSVCMVGLTFTILRLHGSDQMLLIGTVSQAAALLVVVATSLSNWNSKLTFLVMRATILGGISLMTLMK